MALFTIDDISESAQARFWAKVDKRGPDECWEWTASRIPRRGYGMFSLSTKRLVKATHMALTLAGKPRPREDVGALHTCDNPPCCNPAHLFWGTQAVNMADAAAKGRTNPSRGTASPLAKLTDAEVAEIRASTLGCVALGRKFGVSPSHANNVRKGRRRG